jgi:hypothetical protein
VESSKINFPTLQSDSHRKDQVQGDQTVQKIGPIFQKWPNFSKIAQFFKKWPNFSKNGPIFQKWPNFSKNSQIFQKMTQFL